MILAGPGNVKKHISSRPITIDISVGCYGKLWDNYISLVGQLKEQAIDGTLAEVIGLPVLGWRVYQQKEVILERGRRNVYDEDVDDYILQYDYEDEDEDEEGITTIQSKGLETDSTTTSPTTAATGTPEIER